MEQTVMQHSVELGDYLAILRRRKMQLFVPLILIFAASVVVAYVLPPVYRSEAVILIEQQEIPVEFVATTVTGYVEQRLQGLKQRLLTYGNLLAVAEKLDLYAEDRQLGLRNEVVTLMRESIDIAMVDVRTSDPSKGSQGTATIAFTVAFDSDTPEVAQKVANELSNLILEENKKERTQQTAEVTTFLEQEREKLRSEISALEKELATFKQEQMEQLPELMDVNLRLFEQTESKIERTEDEIRSLDDRSRALRSELSVTKPHADIITEGGDRLLTASERLSILTAQFLRASSRYSPNHPDVIDLRREIVALSSQGGSTGVAAQLVNELTALRENLSEARQKYSDNHPDVKKLERSVEAVERGLRNAVIGGGSDATDRVTAPDNPRYIALKTELDTTLGNLALQQAKRKQLEDKLAEYQERLFRTPAVERDYKSLSRDYDNARKKYGEIKDKLLEARFAEQLEAGSKAERFTLVQPAFEPSSPESPNRLGIVLLGVVFSFMGGVGFASAAEFLDPSIHGVKGITAVLHAPPLATIPYIENVEDAARQQRRRILNALLVILAFLAVLSVVHFAWKPLDELWLELTDNPADVLGVDVTTE